MIILNRSLTVFATHQIRALLCMQSLTELVTKTS